MWLVALLLSACPSEAGVPMVKHAPAQVSEQAIGKWLQQYRVVHRERVYPERSSDTLIGDAVPLTLPLAVPPPHTGTLTLTPRERCFDVELTDDIDTHEPYIYANTNDLALSVNIDDRNVDVGVGLFSIHPDHVETGGDSYYFRVPETGFYYAGSLRDLGLLTQLEQADASTWPEWMLAANLEWLGPARLHPRERPAALAKLASARANTPALANLLSEARSVLTPQVVSAVATLKLDVDVNEVWTGGVQRYRKRGGVQESIALPISLDEPTSVVLVDDFVRTVAHPMLPGRVYSATELGDAWSSPGHGDKLTVWIRRGVFAELLFARPLEVVVSERGVERSRALLTVNLGDKVRALVSGDHLVLETCGDTAPQFHYSLLTLIDLSGRPRLERNQLHGEHPLWIDRDTLAYVAPGRQVKTSLQQALDVGHIFDIGVDLKLLNLRTKAVRTLWSARYDRKRGSFSLKRTGDLLEAQADERSASWRIGPNGRVNR